MVSKGVTEEDGEAVVVVVGAIEIETMAIKEVVASEVDIEEAMMGDTTTGVVVVGAVAEEGATTTRRTGVEDTMMEEMAIEAVVEVVVAEEEAETIGEVRICYKQGALG